MVASNDTHVDFVSSSPLPRINLYVILSLSLCPDLVFGQSFYPR